MKLLNYSRVCFRDDDRDADIERDLKDNDGFTGNFKRGTAHMFR